MLWWVNVNLTPVNANQNVMPFEVMAPERTDPRRSSPPPTQTGVTELSVAGMNCRNCVRQVTEAIQGQLGVASVEVSLEDAQARVVWQPGIIPNLQEIVRAVERAGFRPSLPEVASALSIRGMTCSGCARRASEALQMVPGVARVEVELEKNLATIHWQGGASSNLEALIDAVTAAGYGATQVNAKAARAVPPVWSPLSGWRFNVVVGSALTLPLWLAEWVFHTGMERWYHWLSFLLVLPLQTLGGARFYRGAWNQLKVGASNMDTLVALGSTTAFLYSVWGLFAGWSGHLFFMESASIITLISVGHWIESKASAQAEKSLRALLNLTPPTARVVSKGGGETPVLITRLRIGDTVLVKASERIPIDGTVLDGGSTVDESMLTGESAPLEKTPGSLVFGGTANGPGWLTVRVTATGESTALAQIIAAVRRAQNSRAQIQRLGDRVSSVFVPAVVLVALGTGLWWGFAPDSAHAVTQWLEGFLWPAYHPAGALAAAIYHAAAVLIIACPCAMGLATPVAIMAGANAAAERGILIRDGIALEKAGRITAVLFDKTGTLTKGQAAVAAVQEFAMPKGLSLGVTPIAAALARLSLHPLSQAVARAATIESAYAITDWHERRGAGVEAKLTRHGAPIHDALFRLGSLSWLKESGADLRSAASFTAEWTARGATVLGLAADTRLLGVFALQDEIKPGAAALIRQLQKRRLPAFLVTGDNSLTAAAIAAAVGIDRTRVFAEVRPEAKARLVAQLQKQGHRIAFVGDGINDGPALEQADLGIAVSRASDVAREAADIILLNSDIQAIPEALGLAQATLRTIKQNLFWAFFYNALGVPLAVFGFLSPILSAFAMGASDLIVIGNALRLRRWSR